MRFTACFNLVLVSAFVLALAAHGQSTSGPTLLPPPLDPAGAVDAYSQPWQVPSGSDSHQPPANSNSTVELPATEVMPIPIEEALPPPAEASSASQNDAPEAGELLDLNDPSGWYQPTYWFGPAPWDTGIELGLNGSSGTSESLSIRTGGYIKRESRFSKLDLSTYYNRTTDGGVATQNNAQVDVRNDWLLDEQSPWTLYGTVNLFYDEFQAFDLQTSGNTGVGYRFVHEPGLEMLARVGAGTSREIGGPDDRWVPESLVGFEYSQQLSADSKVLRQARLLPGMGRGRRIPHGRRYGLGN